MPDPQVVERVVTERGEWVLRRRGDDWEVISNGVFLMDTSDGRSERLLVSAALDRCRAASPAVLIGGLGVGFSLLEAVERPGVARIDVAEIEPALARWHARHLTHLTGAALADPRVAVRIGDVADLLRAARPASYDVVCLDTDNGPGWLATPGNAGLYAPGGLDLIASRLSPEGVLAVWGAAPDPSYDALLRTRFAEVTVLEVPRSRGAPDVVWLAAAAAPGPDLD